MRLLLLYCYDRLAEDQGAGVNREDLVADVLVHGMDVGRAAPAPQRGGGGVGARLIAEVEADDGPVAGPAARKRLVPSPVSNHSPFDCWAALLQFLAVASLLSSWARAAGSSRVLSIQSTRAQLKPAAFMAATWPAMP